MRRPTDREPRPGPDDVYPYAGDDDIVAAGFTDGGFPFGVTVREWRRDSLSCEREAGWARAKRAIEDTFAAVAPPGGRVEIGWVSQVGRGLSRSAYAARVDVQPDPHGLSGDWTALVPLEPPSRESLVAELRMLDGSPPKTWACVSPRRSAPAAASSYAGSFQGSRSTQTGRQLLSWRRPT